MCSKKVNKIEQAEQTNGYSSIDQLISDSKLDESSKQIINFLINANKKMAETITQLQSVVQELRIKTNDLERDNSKDSVIIYNLPIGYKGSLFEDFIYFSSTVLGVRVTQDDLRALHPLAKVHNFNSPPPIIAKFVKFDAKNSIFNRKNLLKNFQHPKNGRRVFINERLSSHDVGLKMEAEKRQMVVSTWNSTPFIEVSTHVDYPRQSS